jgi:hypothetical protein
LLIKQVRLRGNQAIAFQDPPEGRDRRHPVDLADEVMGDGFGPGIVIAGDELLAQL